jgi:hypothetical protein
MAFARCDEQLTPPCTVIRGPSEKMAHASGEIHADLRVVPNTAGGATTIAGYAGS